MKLRNLSKIVAITALAISVTACGGGKSTAEKAAATAGSAPTSEAQREAAALPLGQAAPINIKCGAVKPVWVNLNTKAYHEAGDPYYGRTKHGQYMCPSQAAAQGYHRAGTQHKGASESGAMSTQGGAMTNESGAMAGSTKHHKKHGAENEMESPNPYATP
jgi:hypothetical protein